MSNPEIGEGHGNIPNPLHVDGPIVPPHVDSWIHTDLYAGDDDLTHADGHFDFHIDIQHTDNAHSDSWVGPPPHTDMHFDQHYDKTYDEDNPREIPFEVSLLADQIVSVQAQRLEALMEHWEDRILRAVDERIQRGGL